MIFTLYCNPLSLPQPSFCWHILNVDMNKLSNVLRRPNFHLIVNYWILFIWVILRCGKQKTQLRFQKNNDDLCGKLPLVQSGMKKAFQLKFMHLESLKLFTDASTLGHYLSRSHIIGLTCLGIVLLLMSYIARL